MSLQKQLENIDHAISLSTAVTMVTGFRHHLPSMLQSAFADALPYAETFKKDIFHQLSDLEGCVAIRAYLGLDEQQRVRLIFVGVNDANEDILPPEELTGSEDTEEFEAVLFEYGQRCPPICSVTGPLNPPV